MKKVILILMVLISFNAISQTFVPLVSVRGVQIFELTDDGMELTRETKKGDNISFVIESVQYVPSITNNDGTYAIFVELVSGDEYIRYDSPKVERSNKYFTRLMKRFKRKLKRRLL